MQINFFNETLNVKFPPKEDIRLIYNALGNYFKLPIGGGKSMSFDFNIGDFASNYHFNKGRWAKRAKTAGTNVDHVPTFTEYCVDMNKWNRLEPMMFHLDALDDRDFVGKIENFKEDFDKLHRWLNTGVMCDPDGNHPLDRVENRSNRKKDYRIYYDDTARKVIEERFAADLERFDYTF